MLLYVVFCFVFSRLLGIAKALIFVSNCYGFLLFFEKIPSPQNEYELDKKREKKKARKDVNNNALLVEIFFFSSRY
jgi:hypothetical protein